MTIICRITHSGLAKKDIIQLEHRPIVGDTVFVFSGYYRIGKVIHVTLGMNEFNDCDFVLYVDY